ncbi:uncharacterized protein AAES06_024365 [Glossophaga mutica]
MTGGTSNLTNILCQDDPDPGYQMLTVANLIASDPTINTRTQIMDIKCILKSNNRFVSLNGECLIVIVCGALWSPSVGSGPLVTVNKGVFYLSVVPGQSTSKPGAATYFGTWKGKKKSAGIAVPFRRTHETEKEGFAREKGIGFPTLLPLAAGLRTPRESRGVRSLLRSGPPGRAGRNAGPLAAWLGRAVPRADAAPETPRASREGFLVWTTGLGWGPAAPGRAKPARGGAASEWPGEPSPALARCELGPRAHLAEQLTLDSKMGPRKEGPACVRGDRCGWRMNFRRGKENSYSLVPSPQSAPRGPRAALKPHPAGLPGGLSQVQQWYWKRCCKIRAQAGGPDARRGLERCLASDVEWHLLAQTWQLGRENETERDPRRGRDQT